MSWRLTLLLFSVFLIASAFFFAQKILSLRETPLLCQESRAYTVGSFDRRFGISYQYFLSALAEAETVWEEPLGKELFVYAPETGELAINLIYDYRQEVTATLSNIDSTVKEDETAYNTLQSRYLKLKVEYEKAKNTYDAQVKIFDKRSRAYEQQIEVWNNGPRTSQKQFNQLEEEKAVLQRAVVELKTTEARLNTMVQDVNSLVDKLNHLARTLNLNVETYNTIGASRGETFTGGLYSQNEDGESISIYEFSDREKLVRVLAHELGHALGLEHVNDPKAIMYYLNVGEAEVVTEADLAELRALCYTEDIKN